MRAKDPTRFLKAKLRPVQLGAHSVKVYHYTAASKRNKRGESICGIEAAFHPVAQGATLCGRCRSVLDARDRRVAAQRKARQAREAVPSG